MSEPIHLRVKRILAGRIEDVVDAMERAGGPSVMREAVREVERAIDDVRTAQVAAASQRLQAVRQQEMAAEHVQKLTDKAKFAIEQGRDDLAEAAIVRQIDFEGQIPTLKTAEVAAASEEDRLEAFVQALVSRKLEMEQTLAAYELAQRDAPAAAKSVDGHGSRVEKAVARAETAFDRAMDGAGGTGFTRSQAGVVTKVAELDVMQRQSVVQDRLAALKAAS
jgi:phage shock protein A